MTGLAGHRWSEPPGLTGDLHLCPPVSGTGAGKMGSGCWESRTGLTVLPGLEEHAAPLGSPGRSERKHTPREVVPYLAVKGGFCAVASEKLAGSVMTSLPCLQSMWQCNHLVFIASLAFFLLPFLQQLDSSGSFPFWRREGTEPAPLHLPLLSNPLLPSPLSPPLCDSPR